MLAGVRKPPLYLRRVSVDRLVCYSNRFVVDRNRSMRQLVDVQFRETGERHKYDDYDKVH